MLTYNQKYKDEVLVGLTNKTHLYMDNSITDNGLIYAIGQKTGDSYPDNIDIYDFALICVKPDNILNLNDANIKINSDSGLITTGTLKGFSANQMATVTFPLRTPIHINPPKNVTFDNFNPNQGMTLPINGLTDKTNVLNFTATIDTPNNVKCNYTQGTHQFIKGQGVNVLFTGDLKKGDNIIIKRSDRNDQINTLKYDTDLLFVSLGMDTSNTLGITYKAIEPVTPPTTTRYLYPTLSHAKITDPQSTLTDWGTVQYILKSDHPLITIKADDGYTFEENGTLSYKVGTNVVNTINIEPNHNDTITINIPNTVDWTSDGGFHLTIGASKPTVVENSGVFTNIYKADYAPLLSFSNEAINKISGGSNTENIDLMPYINNLIMIPFKVPVDKEDNVVAGNTKFSTQMPTVDINFLTVDLGNINVSEQYHNGYDYNQVKTRLMLPYTNMIELDPMHVINKTISVDYNINVINGDTTINVYSNKDLFLSQQVNLANEIPFISRATSGKQYTVINQLKTHYRNDIKQAYIIIEQPTPILNASYYPTNEKGLLKDYNGNVKAKLLNNINIDSNELKELQNLLETGVKIK